VTGVAFLAGFRGISSGSGAPTVVLAFTAAVVLVWGWLSSTSIHLYRHLRWPRTYLSRSIEGERRCATWFC
jgi:hypothetical protein